MSNDARYQLFRRCYYEAVQKRKDETRIPSPFFDMGYIENPWPVFQEFYEGKHWERMGRLPAWKSRPVDNKCFQAAESYTTQLTDSKPKVGFYPRESSDEQLAKVTQGYFDYWWEVAYGSRAIYNAVKDSRKFGVGWLCLEWDADEKRQKLYSVHPESVLVDPDCTSDEFEPTYLIYEYVAQVGELKSAFPDADWESFSATTDESAGAGMLDRILKRIGMGNTTVSNPAKSAVVYEMWLSDPEQIEWDVALDDGETFVTKRGKKYKNGRVLTIAGGIVLDDRESIYKHGKPCLIPIHAYPESGKFYGSSDIGNILPSQVLLNRVNQLLFDGTVKAGGGIVLVNPNFGLTKTSITNDPVQVREVKDVNAALRMQQFPSPPRHLFDFGTYLSRISDDMAGIHDISRGVFTPGNKTVAEVDVLSESDKTRVRMAARNLALAIQCLGHMWLSNVAQFEDKERIVRISGEDGQMESVPFSGKDLRKKGAGNEWSLSPLDLIADDSSTLPARQREREQLAMELHSRDLVDGEEVLRTIDWPNYKAVLARMAPQKAAAEAGAMGGGPQPPAGGGMPPELAAMMAGGAPPQPQPNQPMMGEMPSPMSAPPMGEGATIPPELMATLPPELQQLPPEMLASVLAEVMGNGQEAM